MAYSHVIFPKEITASRPVCAGHASQFPISESSSLQEELLMMAFFVLKVFAFLAIVLWPWQVAE